MSVGPPSSSFDAALCQARCIQLGLALGRRVDYARVTDSTNDDAMAMAKAGAPHGLTIVAERQRRGRGRRGREWFSAPGTCLTFSLLLRASWSVEELSVLPLVMGLAVRQAVVQRVAGRVAVKWPNDVMVDDRKVGGVLCESYSRAGQVLAVVVGVGLNVQNQKFPPPLAPLVTSLEAAGAAGLSRENLLVDVLKSLDRRLVELSSEGFARQRQELTQCDALAGRRIQIGTRVGVGGGIAANGALLFEHDGQVDEVVSGTISLLA